MYRRHAVTEHEGNSDMEQYYS